MTMSMSPQGETIDVELVRMQSEVIADKRRHIELFATLKDRAVGKHLCFGSSLFQFGFGFSICIN